MARAMALLLPLALLGCRDANRQGALPIRVFAAASLADTFTDLARAFERQHAGQPVQLRFAGTPQLLLQLREGARVDVLATADPIAMQAVVATGATTAAPQQFAQSQLTIVVGKGNPKAVRGLADLQRKDLTVALCGKDVPAGRYARQALQRANVTVASVSDEASVRALVSKVALGELDAGIVYATDVRRGDVDSVPIAAADNVVVSYPIVALQVGENRAGGLAFVAFVRSQVGGALLTKHGFVLP